MPLEPPSLRKTAVDWLTNFEANREVIDRNLACVYGDTLSLWWMRSRLFFLATAGLFGAQGVEEWCVSRFLLRRTSTEVVNAM